MELLDFIQSIGGHITFRSGHDHAKMLVVAARGGNDLRTRPYPGGSGSISGWGTVRNGDLNAAYDEALTDLAATLSDEPKVGFTHDQVYAAPTLVHTKGYRPKSTKRKKVLS